MSLSVEYRTELFDTESAAAMCRDLLTLLRLGLSEPAVPLSDLWPGAASPETGATGPGPHERGSHERGPHEAGPHDAGPYDAG